MAAFSLLKRETETGAANRIRNSLFRCNPILPESSITRSTAAILNPTLPPTKKIIRQNSRRQKDNQTERGAALNEQNETSLLQILNMQIIGATKIDFCSEREYTCIRIQRKLAGVFEFARPPGIS